MNKYKKNQTGIILLLTLFILSGILVITLGAADLVFAGIKMNRLAGYSNLAFFASEAGMERALWEVRKNNYVLPNVDTTNVFSLGDLGNGSSYSVNYATSTPYVIFKSIGSYRGVKRSVESTYEVQ
jgi:Tfp pilus assembly protein PilX